MVAPQPAGTYLNLDVVFPGLQAQVEHRIPIYGPVNELNLKANTLLTLPFMESQADFDLRLLVLSLGGSVGFRDNFRTLEFLPGEPITRGHRRDVDDAGLFKNTTAGYYEGRGTLALPFNDHALLLSVTGVRYEGGPDRTFDWRAGMVRDHGVVVRSDTTLFFKHKSFGAAGPMFEALDVPLDGKRRTLLNYGFTVVTRPGFRHANDLLFLAVLINFGSALGGFDAHDIYGNHTFYGQYTFQLAYRAVFELQGPTKPGADDEILN